MTPDVQGALDRLREVFASGLWSLSPIELRTGRLADLDLLAQEIADPAGTCTNKGCALEDRAGKSYQCTGDAQWCTACLRWHYEPLLQRAEQAEARCATLEAATIERCAQEAERVAMQYPASVFSKLDQQEMARIADHEGLRHLSDRLGAEMARRTSANVAAQIRTLRPEGAP